VHRHIQRENRVQAYPLPPLPVPTAVEHRLVVSTLDYISTFNVVVWSGGSTVYNIFFGSIKIMCIARRY
jgi:hypothetical protein